MTTLLVGSNVFAGWTSLIALRGAPLVHVDVNPLRVSLTPPPDLPSRRVVRVVDNKRSDDSAHEVRVTETDKSVAIFWVATPLLIATLIDPTTVSLRLDLRPLGIDVFEDNNALQIAGSRFASNSFRGAGGTAINLA